ncbi:MAG: hypothetical protein AB8B84_03650 [Granulosicoccus sp.]
MIKSILLLASVTLLAACSSGGSGSNPGTTDPAPPSGNGARAGAYIGDFGSGNGVYVLAADNSISGLALNANGSAQSLFGNLGAGSTFTGNLNSHFHTSSAIADQGIFGPGEPTTGAPTIEFNLNIVDGQTIESLSGSAVNLTAAGDGALSAATPAGVAGSWSGSHQFCVSDLTQCSNLLTEITFSGTTVTGRTVVISSTGEETFPNQIDGSIAAVNDDVSTLTFTWNNNTYNGSIAFLPNSTTQLVFLGETTASGANNVTIASLLTR